MDWLKVFAVIVLFGATFSGLGMFLYLIHNSAQAGAIQMVLAGALSSGPPFLLGAMALNNTLP